MTGIRRFRGMARADFLRSIGVYVAQDRLYMVRMRRSLFRFALVQAESIPFEEKREASFRERHLVDAIQALLPMLGPKNTPVYLCFAPELAVECQVSLPEAARNDVERVLDYELERLIPFRRDEVYYDYVLAPGATGGKISVSLFAVPKTLVDPVLDSLASGGYELLGAESVATSLFNYLLFLNRHEAGSDVVIGGRDDALLVDGLRTSRGWSTSSEILYTHRMPNSSWSRGLGKEMLEGLIEESPRFYCWGDVGDIIEEDGPLASAENLLELGQDRILMPASVSEEFVPAIGACLRGLRESVLRVNFLPGSKHKSEAKSSFRLNGLLTALLLLSLMVWGASYAIKDEIRLRRMKSGDPFATNEIRIGPDSALRGGVAGQGRGTQPLDSAVHKAGRARCESRGSDKGSRRALSHDSDRCLPFQSPLPGGLCGTAWHGGQLIEFDSSVGSFWFVQGSGIQRSVDAPWQGQP